MRCAGILLPISSLPAPHGVGTLGAAAHRFIGFLAKAGQSLWQILPIGPTGYGNSPYQSFSAFAGNPYWIDLDVLCQQGLLLPGEIGGHFGQNTAAVNYGLLFRQRFTVLEKAVNRQNKNTKEYKNFCRQNAFWLDDYALFMAIKESQNQAALLNWPPQLRLRSAAAMASARSSHAQRAVFWQCLQYFFFTQWRALQGYAKAHGVGIVGDIPIYVSHDSSDFWAQPSLFKTDEQLRPAYVAGVPPDAFSQDGQLWGNPLYNWPQQQSSGYAWWLARLRQAQSLFSKTRIDHFRGFADYYAIKAGSENAKNGSWENGPGLGFINAIQQKLPHMQIIAEDLGYLTPEVHRLLKASGYPGMKILQFAFSGQDDNDYLPHRYTRHCVVYTGTHDNTTTAAWVKQAPPATREYARSYLGVPPGQRLAPAMVRAALASAANTAIIPMQDWLGLGESARINQPAILDGNNWCWRLLPGQLSSGLAAKILAETQAAKRLPRARPSL